MFFVQFIQHTTPFNELETKLVKNENHNLNSFLPGVSGMCCHLTLSNLVIAMNCLARETVCLYTLSLYDILRQNHYLPKTNDNIARMCYR